MIYDLSNSIEKSRFKAMSNYFINNSKKVELIQKVDTRTSRQNSALHLFFTMVSDQLNELGMEFKYSGLNDNDFSLRHTPTLVKEFVWKPIQLALFDIESTTKLNTHQMNEIIDVIVKYFGEKGIVLEFPSIESLIK
jgi:hypothetical protein